MDMPVHKTRHHRAVARIECGVSSGVCRRVEFDDALALNQYRLDRLLRVCKFTSKEFADVFDQKCSQRPLLLVRKLLSPRNPGLIDNGRFDDQYSEKFNGVRSGIEPTLPSTL